MLVCHPSNHLTHSHRATPPQANLGDGALLKLCNSVRESLAKRGDFGPAADELSFFLELALLEETNGVPSLDLETIKAAHLDKLVAELTQCGEMPFALAPRFVHDVVTAETLERMWRARFRVDYLMIDEIRASDLAARWGLREGRQAHRGAIGLEPWAVKGLGATGYRTGEARFTPGGMWWLNLACAYLDGVVGTKSETTSRGDDKTPTLPLLTGREIHAGHDRVRYLREGTLADMQPALIPQAGKHVRVLRGYQLRSHFAPTVGIRNDGLWKVLKYGERLVHTTGRYRLELDLEKVPGHPPMPQLMRIPRPSDLDDWDLYKRLEVGKVAQGAYHSRISRSEGTETAVKKHRMPIKSSLGVKQPPQE